MDRTLASIKNSRRRTKRQRLETSEQSREETSEGISIIDPPAKSHNRVNPPKYVCETCEDPANSIQSLLNNPCNHKFCNHCIVNYITSKLDMNIAIIPCPHTGCKSRSLDPLTYQEILPADTFNKWGLILCEFSLGSKKFYCPFKDCSALLVNDGCKEVINCECPHCHRMFCAKCKVPWHGDMSCEKFQELGKDEAWQENLILEKLAKDKGWRRCHRCRIYMDKIDGCKFMECRKERQSPLISTPIVKCHDTYTLEAADGVTVKVEGMINQTSTLKNGFSHEVPDMSPTSVKRSSKKDHVPQSRDKTSGKGSRRANMKAHGATDYVPLSESNIRRSRSGRAIIPAVDKGSQTVVYDQNGNFAGIATVSMIARIHSQPSETFNLTHLVDEGFSWKDILDQLSWPSST